MEIYCHAVLCVFLVQVSHQMEHQQAEQAQLEESEHFVRNWKGFRLLDITISLLLHVVRYHPLHLVYPLWCLSLFLYLVFIHAYCCVVAISEAPHCSAADSFVRNEQAHTDS
jgi:hypothetical protein